MPVPPARVTLSVRLPPGHGEGARLTHFRVDDTHSNAYAAWLALGSPAAPDAAQRARLEDAMRLATLSTAGRVDAPGGVVTVQTELPRFGVSLVVVEPE